MKDFAKKILADVDNGKEFILHISGKVRKVKNIIDLQHEIKNMSDEEFNHHVNDAKNDFAVWIQEILGDETLSRDVKNTNSKEEIVKLLHTRISFGVKILEQENKKLVNDEMKRLEILSKEKKESVAKEIKKIKEDTQEIENNLEIEKNLIRKLETSEIKALEENPPISIHTSILEFIFGLAIGLAGGIVLARIIFGI